MVTEGPEAVATEATVHTPEEQTEDALSRPTEDLAEELLDRIAEQSPAFFEQLVLDVLHAMGYGGTRAAAERLGQSGDGGVDGVIREDPLGLDLTGLTAVAIVDDDGGRLLTASS